MTFLVTVDGGHKVPLPCCAQVRMTFGWTGGITGATMTLDVTLGVRVIQCGVGPLLIICRLRCSTRLRAFKGFSRD